MANRETSRDRFRTGEATHRLNSTMKRAQTSRRRLLHLLGAGGVVGLAGCAGGQNETATQTEAGDDQSQGEQREIDRSLTVALSTDPTDSFWDVYGGVTPYYTRILEPLVSVTTDMELRPWLATEWEATGKQTWEFSLREGVTFHNGAPLTADAVVFSLRELTEAYGFTTNWLQYESDGIKALDERTVEVTNVEPFPTFPGAIAHYMVVIQHPSRDTEQNEMIGTGPFQLEVVNKQQVKTTAFEGYWNETPEYIEEFEFRVIEDPNTRALSLKSGEVDIAFEPPRSQYDTFKEADDSEVVKQAEPRAVYIGCNLYSSPTDDVKFRKALNHAVSQETLVDTVLNGIGMPADGPIPNTIYWSAHGDLPKYEYDPEKAKRLVTESTYTDQQVEFLVDADMTDSRIIAEAVQEMFNQAGITVDIRALESGTYSDAARNGKGQLILIERGTKSGAADYVIDGLLRSDGFMNGILYSEEGTGLFNLGNDVDELVNRGRTTGDPDVKKEAYGEAQQRVMEEAVFVPLFYTEYYVGQDVDVSGLQLHPIQEMIHWKNIKKLK